ncbi:MAG: VOC family protein, partial [Gammaproteobacteria bacterium]|nr:VOC family protein [Gammaproteobacteria bacterium]
MPELGHVVFYVRRLAPMLAFYTDVVGLTSKGSIFHGRAALLTGGRTHHELLLIEVGDGDGPLTGHRIG